MWLDRGVTLARARLRIVRGWRDRVLEEEEREQRKLGRKIVAEEHWMRYGVTAAQAQHARRSGCWQMRDFREYRGAGQREHRDQRGGAVGKRDRG